MNDISALVSSYVRPHEVLRFADHSKRLFDSDVYADLTVVCNGKSWKVHKAIVCSRSRFFDAAMKAPFREAETGVIDLSSDAQDAVDRMLYCQ